MGRVYYQSLGGSDPKVLRAIFLCHGGKENDYVYITGHRARAKLFESFGIPFKGQKIPFDAEGEFEVEEFKFKLYSSVVRQKRFSTDGTGREIECRFVSNRKHRLFIDCPACNVTNWIPVGRFWQHAIVHNKARGANTFPPSTLPESFFDEGSGP